MPPWRQYAQTGLQLGGTGIGAFYGGAPGAAVGSSIGSMLGGLLGQDEQSPFEKEAESAQMDLLKGLRQPAQKFDFAPIEQQARRQFEEQTIPGIAERFTGMGGQRSSAFQQGLGGAGAGLEENLANLRGQFGMQQQQAERGQMQDLSSFLAQNQQTQQAANMLRQQGMLGLGQQFTGFTGMMGAQQQTQQQQTLDAISKALGIGTVGKQETIITPEQKSAVMQFAQQAGPAAVKIAANWLSGGATGGFEQLFKLLQTAKGGG